jgi:hypothetical protein
MVQLAELFAAGVERETSGTPNDQVRRAFQLALGRSPETNELEAAMRLVAEHGLPSVCRALLNANEFLFLP